MNMQTTFAPLVADHKRRLVLFLFLMTAMFMATLDNQIVSTALPTIVGEFGHLERFGWIGSAYLLSLSAVMPVYGKLGDLFGRKYVMMTAIAIFTIGSAVCGLAVSMNTLIAARVLQGFGGGGIMVSIFAVNADLFEPRERARYQSYSSLVLMASGAIGPVLGGTMSDLFGWRSIFLVNVPIGFVVLAGLAFMLPYRKPARRPKIDYAGAIVLALTTTSIVLAADGTELFGSLLSPQCLGIIAFGVICVVSWVFIERRAQARAFVRIEPACVFGTIVEIPESPYADERGEQAFDEKKPLPAREAERAMQFEQRARQRTAENKRQRRAEIEHADGAGTRTLWEPVCEVINDAGKEACFGDA